MERVGASPSVPAAAPRGQTPSVPAAALGGQTPSVPAGLVGIGYKPECTRSLSEGERGPSVPATSRVSDPRVPAIAAGSLHPSIPARECALRLYCPVLPRVYPPATVGSELLEAGGVPLRCPERTGPRRRERLPLSPLSGGGASVNSGVAGSMVVSGAAYACSSTTTRAFLRYYALEARNSNSDGATPSQLITQ